MKWTPPSDAVRADEWKPPADAVVQKKVVEEPGWFMPGSKSEALARGAIQGVTLGFGDEIQAYLRGAMNREPGESYSDATRRLKAEERAANQSSAAANPVTYGAGQIAGSVLGASPAIAGIGAGRVLPTVAAGAGVGAVQGAGMAETMEDVPAAAAQGAAISGVLSGAGAAVKPFGKLLQRVTAMPAAKNMHEIAEEAAKKSGIPNAHRIYKSRDGEVIVDKAGYRLTKLGERTSIPPMDYGKIFEQRAARLAGAKEGTKEGAFDVAQIGVPAFTGVTSGLNAVSDSDDPSSGFLGAVGDFATNAAVGAATGYAGVKGVQKIGELAPKAINLANRAGGAMANVAPGRPAALPTIGANVGAQVTPFGNLLGFLDKSRGVGAPNEENQEINQLAQQADEVAGEDERKRRQAQMQLNSTPAGRAVANTSSPVRQ